MRTTLADGPVRFRHRANCRGDTGRTMVSVVLILIVIVAAGLIGLSPFALVGFDGADAYWERLSFIGQTYGAASALLAGLALVGVVATLVLQARETRNARELALRDSNSELLRMAMENPEYQECWGSHFPDSDSTAHRQAMYTNMIFSQWEMAYDSGAISDDLLRIMVDKVFAGRVGWEFWRKVREDRISTSASRRARRFHRIIDEEFQQLPEPRRPAAAPEPQRPRRRRRIPWLGIGGGAAAGAFALAVVWLWRRRLAGTDRGWARKAVSAWRALPFRRTRPTRAG